MSTAPLRRLRPAAQGALQPLVRASIGVDPDLLTTAGLATCLMTPIALHLGAPAWMFAVGAGLRLVFDVLDGEVARASGRATPAGALLGDAAEGIGDAILYGGLAVVRPDLAAPVVVVLVLGLLAEYMAVATAAHGGVRRQDGPLGKVERLVGVSLAVVLASPALLWGLAGLGALTTVRRLVAGRRGLR